MHASVQIVRMTLVLGQFMAIVYRSRQAHVTLKPHGDGQIANATIARARRDGK